MKIPYVNLVLQWEKERKFLLPLIKKTLEKGEYVGGKQISIFEKNISKVCGTKYAVGLNSGTDALTLAYIVRG